VKLVLYILVVASLRAMTLAVEAAEISAYDVGTWRVSAYANDTTGSFSHCAASVPYRSGIILGIGVDNGFRQRRLGATNRRSI
jgi:hypothetical protein